MMKRKLLVGTIAVFVIAAASLMFTLIAGALIAVWIYLVWMVWKKKTGMFHDQMEPELAERRLRRLNALLVVAGISFAVFVVGVIVHNALYGLSEMEEPVSFIIAIVAAWVFMIATTGGLVIFVKGRREPPQRNTEIGAI